MHFIAKPKRLTLTAVLEACQSRSVVTRVPCLWLLFSARGVANPISGDRCGKATGPGQHHQTAASGTSPGFGKVSNDHNVDLPWPASAGRRDVAAPSAGQQQCDARSPQLQSQDLRLDLREVVENCRGKRRAEVGVKSAQAGQTKGELSGAWNKGCGHGLRV